MSRIRALSLVTLVATLAAVLGVAPASHAAGYRVLTLDEINTVLYNASKQVKGFTWSPDKANFLADSPGTGNHCRVKVPDSRYNVIRAGHVGKIPQGEEISKGEFTFALYTTGKARGAAYIGKLRKAKCGKVNSARYTHVTVKGAPAGAVAIKVDLTYSVPFTSISMQRGNVVLTVQEWYPNKHSTAHLVTGANAVLREYDKVALAPAN
jgi:hypothetical protein